MLQYLTKRIGMALITLFIIMLVSYLLIRMAPGDPTKSTFLGENSGDAAGLSAEKGAFVKKTLP